MKMPSQLLHKKGFLFLAGISRFCLLLLLPLLINPQGLAQPLTNKNPINDIYPLREEQGKLFTPTPTPTPIPAPSHTTMATFVGNWYIHDGIFIIQPDGHAFLTARAQIWCSGRVKPPCDQIKDGQIMDGIQESILLTHVAGISAYGKIIASTTGKTGKSIVVTLGPNDTISLPDLGTYCGPHAPSGYCGA